MTRRVLTAAIGVLLLLPAAACTGNQSMFNPQGPGARGIASLGWLLLALSGLIYVIVLGVMFRAIARRRLDTDDLPGTTRRLNRNVTIATVLSAVVLVGLTVSSVVAGRGLTSPSGPGAVHVTVTSRQWWWDFRYDDISPSDVFSSANELHIPVGVPIVLTGSSQDVIHSLWVPNLQGKRDLIPGQTTQLWLQADRPGVYRGQCAEFCGYQHAKMAFLVIAQPMDEFLAWARGQRQPAREPTSADEVRGRDLFLQSPCVTCHTIRGTDAGSRVGPDLTHVASRLTIGAGTLPNTRAHLSEWILNSQVAKPGNRMPANPFAPAELEQLLTYVRSLR